MSIDRVPEFTPAQYKYACNVMRVLKKQKNAVPFLAPVDPVALGIPHYATLVTRPMDFGTIERKLFDTVPLPGRPAAYKTVGEWEADVQQVFENTYLFNGREHPVSKMAMALEGLMKKEMRKMPGPDDGIPATPDEERSQVSTPAVQNPPPLPSTEAEILAEQMAFCSKILTHLQKPEFATFAWFFYNPVKEEELPGYHKVIDKPMSLAVMRKKLDAGEYPDPQAFKRDFDQIVWNCNKFNPPHSVAQAAAKSLKDLFDKKWKTLLKIGANRPILKQASFGDVRKVPASAAPSSTKSPGSRRASLVAPSPVEAPSPATFLPPTPLPVASGSRTPALLPSVLPSPSADSPRPSVPPTPSVQLPQGTPSKRKAELPPDDPELTAKEHRRLSKAIHKLTGAELARAIDMLQDGIGDTPRYPNDTGDEEYEVAALPPGLVSLLYTSFVVGRERRSKRPRRAAPEVMVEASDSE